MRVRMHGCGRKRGLSRIELVVTVFSVMVELRYAIRDATEDDLPAIIDIYNQSIPAGRATADTKPISVADRMEWFRKFDSARRPIWVAEESGRVIGCVYLSSFYGGRPAYDKTAEISTPEAEGALERSSFRTLPPMT
jgi:hypothetical protein